MASLKGSAQRAAPTQWRQGKGTHMNTSAKSARLAAAPESDTRWAAVVARDPRADDTCYANGQFDVTANAAAQAVTPGTAATGVAERVQALDWEHVSQDLDVQGSAIIERLLAPDECQAVAGLYPQDGLFRSRVVMGRHGFGRGEYRYFSYPLPDLIADLRTAVFPHLVPIANCWNTAMGIDVHYPERHADFLARCHQAGQVRPTPLLLQYGADDYNCLHQDLYGEHVFPLQLAILLSV